MTVSRRFACALATLSLTSLWSPTLSADLHDELDGRWYVTELIIFERPGVGYEANGEVLISEADWAWPDDVHLIRHEVAGRAELTRLSYRERDRLNLRSAQTQGGGTDDASDTTAPPNAPSEARDSLRDAIAEFETGLVDAGPVWLDEAALTMNSHKLDLQRRLRARILFHGAWRQDLPERTQPYPIMLPLEDEGAYGVVSMTVNRYLHVKADLQFPFPARYIDPAPGSAEPGVRVDGGTMSLSERRRLRSEELHYLDHPRFGVLLRVQEIGFPAELETLWDAAEGDR